MKATLYLNYNPLEHNLDSLLNDAYQLPYKHISKAESIPEKLFVNEEKKVFGTLFSVVGNAASQYQFFLTDSTKHFLVGSLYFYARPNYDSIYPAADYLQKDIIHLIESFKWK
jgi:gliding motility-associated lipoprotein GldD